ncbi:MAG: sigma-54-dependent Fis family transcriptional regulator [Planctomycetes bacterium]|nr:sigma-54-dependent Fis family transcriptional regulator [Planctomycetota bacterium]
MSNLGHIHLALGEYEKGEAWLERALASWPQGGGGRIAILDGLAQSALARSDLEKCSQYLSLVDVQTTGSLENPSYYQLCTFQTRARLLMKQGQWPEARRFLRVVLPGSKTTSVPAITNLLRLLKAEASLMTGHEAEAAQLIYQAASSGEGTSVEVLAEIARVAGAALAKSGALASAVSQFERAAGILASVGHLQARTEVLKAYRDAISPAIHGTEAGTPPPIAARPVPRRARHILFHADAASPLLPLPAPSPATAVERAAALIDLAAYPEILGHEIFALLRETAAASEVVLTAGAPSPARQILAHAGCDYRRARTLAAAHRSAIRLRLGTWHDRPYEIVVNPASTIASRMTVLAVEKLTSAALRLDQAKREERERTALWPLAPREDADGAIFASRYMIELAATVRKVAPTTVPILLTGETGTGKEVMARLIHRASARADKPLVPFNCNAVPRDMLDSQLFGYRRGAFTGAHADFPGVIRAAAGGTLFLDEIGELSLDVQPKLLRFLESGEILPLGDSRPATIDVRVIASTNARLEQFVKTGRFREDLFYRLNVIRFKLPPLRERREEIPPLVEHFLERYSREYQREHLRVAEETMEYLLLYGWPGNVRQLANEMRRLAALAENSAVLMPEHLSSEIIAGRRTIPAAERQLGPAEVVVRIDQPLSAAIEHVERTMIRKALKDAGGCLDKAARALGLSRKGLYLKRRRLQIDEGASA